MIDATKVREQIQILNLSANLRMQMGDDGGRELASLAQSLEALLSRNEKLEAIGCPDNAGGFHRWNDDGQCLDCCNYATDMIDKALQDNEKGERSEVG